MKKIVPILITLSALCVWGFLLVISHAFLLYSEPLDSSDKNFFLLFCIKYFPVISLLVLPFAIYASKKSLFGSIALSLLPSVLLTVMLILSFRDEVVTWDEYESTAHEQFIRSSAFGGAEDIFNSVAEGMDPNIFGIGGNNALLTSYSADNINTFKALLEVGADPNELPNGKIQYNVAFRIIGDFYQRKNSLRYFELLLENGLDINLGYELKRLIHEASNSDDIRYLKLLAEKGADTNVKGSLSLSPIGLATLHLDYENAIYLIPYSNQDSLIDAAAILEGDLKRNRPQGNDRLRNELTSLLQDRGINFKKAFELRERERIQRLQRFESKR